MTYLDPPPDETDESRDGWEPGRVRLDALEVRGRRIVAVECELDVHPATREAVVLEWRAALVVGDDTYTLERLPPDRVYEHGRWVNVDVNRDFDELDCDPEFWHALAVAVREQLWPASMRAAA